MKLTRRILLAAGLAGSLLTLAFQAAPQAKSADPLIAAFQDIPTASLADAVDLVTGKPGFMTHDMRPRTGNHFAGRALTSLLKPAPPEQAVAKLTARHSVEMIDSAKPGEVGVIVIEQGLDVAGLGGLMGTTARSREMAGIVIDGGVRDVGELRDMGLTVFARSIVPSSTVGHFASVANNVPVNCAGVQVAPGDIVVGDEDGVVVVPQARAAEVLKKAQEIDEREKKMVPMIKQYKSLRKVIELFNRI